MSIEKPLEEDKEVKEPEEGVGLYARPDGTTITESEHEDEERRKKEYPNWFREQK